jgi:medium-chain acyl-[acyl-carrier-protein] hydrolase
MVAQGTSWLEFLQPRWRPRLRLLCFPYAGGSAAAYREWQKALPDSIEVWPIQLPGRGRRLSENPYTQLARLIGDLGEDILCNMPGPFAVFGYSMGALIAFELARRAQEKGTRGPIHLFVAARRAPHLPPSNTLTYDLPEFELIAELGKMQGTPTQLLEDPEAMRLFLPTIRADFELVQTYRFQAGLKLNCPITALGGVRDSSGDYRQIEPWKAQTSARFAVRMFPGDHFFINTCQRALVSVVEQELNQHLGTA